MANQAIYAAKHVKSWGVFAARRYCEKRGIPLRLYYLARTLEAAKGL